MISDNLENQISNCEKSPEEYDKFRFLSYINFVFILHSFEFEPKYDQKCKFNKIYYVFHDELRHIKIVWDSLKLIWWPSKIVQPADTSLFNWYNNQEEWYEVSNQSKQSEWNDKIDCIVSDDPFLSLHPCFFKLFFHEKALVLPDLPLFLPSLHSFLLLRSTINWFYLIVFLLLHTCLRSNLKRLIINQLSLNLLDLMHPLNPNEYENVRCVMKYNPRDNCELALHVNHLEVKGTNEEFGHWVHEHAEGNHQDKNGWSTLDMWFVFVSEYLDNYE